MISHINFINHIANIPFQNKCNFIILQRVFGSLILDCKYIEYKCHLLPLISRKIPYLLPLENEDVCMLTRRTYRLLQAYIQFISFLPVCGDISFPRACIFSAVQFPLECIKAFGWFCVYQQNVILYKLSIQLYF